MVNDPIVMQIFEKRNVVVNDGHFVYTSGHHGSAYVNKDAIYPHIDDVRQICLCFADCLSNKVRHIQMVVGPEKGGIILSQWTAWALMNYEEAGEILAVYAEKKDGGFVFGREYARLVPGKNILIVEDVLTTGGSVRKVANAIHALGGNVIAVVAICNRGGVTLADMNLPKSTAFYTLIQDLHLESWGAEECPMCRAGVSINSNL
jgi:orotate phosphoribosyltransferase